MWSDVLHAMQYLLGEFDQSVNKSSVLRLRLERSELPFDTVANCSFEKSIVLFNKRGGVPVFSRPSSRPISFREPERPIAAASPARPPACCANPMCINPRKNVPVVTTTVVA